MNIDRKKCQLQLIDYIYMNGGVDLMNGVDLMILFDF